MAADTDIIIRECNSLDDYRRCVAVQQIVWGFQDQDLIPARLFVVAHKIEGQVLGAFEPSGRLVGFSLAVPALKGSMVYLHSHMLGVLKEYRERGLGRRLKLEQRRNALARGIKLIEWTFDPLELKNAYFNLVRLGVIVRRYLPNLYGISSSPLHRGLPTDRLVAEWWLDSQRVVARTEGESEPRASASGQAKAASTPTRDTRHRICVPVGVLEGHSAKNAASDVQLELRRQFQQAFSEGLAALDFEIADIVGTYFLGPWSEVTPAHPDAAGTPGTQ